MGDKTVRILSVDGGIRGIVAATVLREILGGQRARDVFHLIAGTSTGGILGCGLAKATPLDPQELIDLYVERGGEIFDRSFWRRLPGFELTEEKYSAGPLETHLLRILGDAKLSEVAGVDLFVPSYAIDLPKPRLNGETRAPLFFRSWRARGAELAAGMSAREHDFFLRDVARATSAAPTYFEPADIRNQAGERFGMIDGGVFAHNPSMSAFIAGSKRYGREHDFLLVSLGTGYLQRPISLDKAKRWDQIGWLHPLLSVLMDGNADTVCAQAEELLGPNHHRFDIPLGVRRADRHAVNDDFDDASPENVRALLAKADDLISSERERIRRLKDLLQEPRSEFERVAMA